MRLVIGQTTQELAFGVPEIFHAGAWGTLCDADLLRFDYFEGSQYTGVTSFNDVRLRPHPLPGLIPSYMQYLLQLSQI